MAGEEQTAASETDSENSNSQPFEMVEKEDVVEEGEGEEQEEKDIEKAPDKGSCVEDIKESSEGELEEEEEKEHKKSTSS